MSTRKDFDWHDKPENEKYMIIPTTKVYKVMALKALSVSGASTQQYLDIMHVSFKYLKKQFEKLPDMKRPYDWKQYSELHS